jgi:hypothetical protein
MLTFHIQGSIAIKGNSFSRLLRHGYHASKNAPLRARRSTARTTEILDLICFKELPGFDVQALPSLKQSFI